MVDDGAAAVGFGDAVVDEPLVQGKVGERPVLAAAGRRVRSGGLRRYRSYTSVMRCFSDLGKLPLGDAGELRWSGCCARLFNRLPRGLAAGWPVLAGGWGRWAAGRCG